jgi:hypothetical protein
VRWLFPGSEVRLDMRCLDCGQPIVVRMRDEQLLEVDPPTAVGHVNAPFAKLLAGEITFGFA